MKFEVVEDSLFTMPMAARALGVCYMTLRKYVADGIVAASVSTGGRALFTGDDLQHAKVALEEVRALRKERKIAIATALAEKYKTRTLGEIGAEIGLTRERVRQILGTVGVTGKDGAQRKRHLSNCARREQQSVMQREARCQKNYGCSWKEFQDLTGARTYGQHKTIPLLRAWWGHKRSSQRAHIAWQFTLPEYAALVGQHLGSIRRGNGGLALTRKDKSGPCSPGNCEVITFSQNAKNTNGFTKGHERRSARAEKRRLEMVAAYRGGATIPEVAKRFKVCTATVSMALQRNRN